MKLLKRLLAALALLLAAVIGVGFLLPSTAHVERSLEIDAPACTVSALVDGYQRFDEFSPWAGRDPQMQTRFEGPPFGVGASMSWSSEDPDVGKGKQTVTALTPCRQVVVALEFDGMDPATATWTIEPIGPRSKVSWALDTDFGWNVVGRYFGLFLDGMVGPDYEAGLGKLKTLAESLPKTDFGTISPELFDATGDPFAFVRVESSADPLSEATAVNSAFAQVVAWYAANQLSPAGFPAAVRTAESDGKVQLEVGLPLVAAPLQAPTGPVQIGTLPAGKALRVVHVGSGADLPVTRERLRAYMAARGIEAGGPWWERVESDPTSTPESERRTQVAVIVR